MLPLLRFIQSDHNPDHPYGFGVLLKRVKDKVYLRRVESLFSACDGSELMEELQAIAPLLKDQILDYGSLYNDLSRFDRSEDGRLQVIRKWSREYFESSTSE